MGKLEYLVIHCTATPQGREVTKNDLINWHIKGRGWSRLGYSDIVHLDGSIENLIDWDQDDVISDHEISNGAKGINSKSRHIVYAGGMDKNNVRPKDTRTRMQTYALEVYVRFHLLRYPNIKVLGHSSVANKACPSFDVARWLDEIGIKSKNIY